MDKSSSIERKERPISAFPNPSLNDKLNEIAYGTSNKPSPSREQGSPNSQPENLHDMPVTEKSEKTPSRNVSFKEKKKEKDGRKESNESKSERKKREKELEKLRKQEEEKLRKQEEEEKKQLKKQKRKVKYVIVFEHLSKNNIHKVCM